MVIKLTWPNRFGWKFVYREQFFAPKLTVTLQEAKNPIIDEKQIFVLFLSGWDDFANLCHKESGDAVHKTPLGVVEADFGDASGGAIAHGLGEVPLQG